MSYVRIFEDKGMNIDAKVDNSVLMSFAEYKKPVLYSCDYCNSVFYNKEDLFNHIRNHHKLDSILMIDNKVKTNAKNIYLSEVKSAIIYKYNPDLDILIDNVCIGVKEYLDITKNINNSLEKKGICHLKIGKKEITFHKHSLSLINEKKLNEIIEQWSFECENDRNLTVYSKNDLNSSEKRYLDGCFNYFLACSANHDDKRNRYQDAYDILSEFYDLNSTGKTILKIIAFRWNWVETLEKICFNCNNVDDFDIILSIINGKELANYDKDSNEISFLYIEDDIKNNIEAFINLFKSNYEDLNQYVNKYEDSDLIDMNLRDRLLFLKGLLFINKNKMRRANNVSKEIINETLQQKFKVIMEKYYE